MADCGERACLEVPGYTIVTSVDAEAGVGVVWVKVGTIGAVVDKGVD